VSKDLLLRLIKSLAITVAVSSVFGIFFSYFNVPFLTSFIFFLVLQFVCFYFYGDFIKRRNSKLKLEAELKLGEEMSKQLKTVICPCDKNIETTIPISINGPNGYICQGCNKNITVFIETKTALSTIPVTVNPLDSPLIVEEVEKLLKQNAS
jgi:transposase-like protein